MKWSNLFNYEADGTLVWKTRPVEHFDGDERVCKLWNTQRAGNVAGCKQTGRHDKPMRITINMLGHGIPAHHIIWEMHNGPIPKGLLIDHENGNPWDNRISNLRLATNAQNLRNVGPTRRNTSGIRGVSWSRDKRKWYASIRVNGKTMNLGCFVSKGMAAVTRAKAALRYHGEFARIG